MLTNLFAAALPCVLPGSEVHMGSGVYMIGTPENSATIDLIANGDQFTASLIRIRWVRPSTTEQTFYIATNDDKYKTTNQSVLVKVAAKAYPPEMGGTVTTDGEWVNYVPDLDAIRRQLEDTIAMLGLPLNKEI